MIYVHLFHLGITDLRHLGNSRSDMSDLWRSSIRPCIGFFEQQGHKNGESARITTAQCSARWAVIGRRFYTLAALHLYLAFQPAGPIFAFILSIAFGAVMVCYGIAHTAYFSIATGARCRYPFWLRCRPRRETRASILPEDRSHHLHPSCDFKFDDVLRDCGREISLSSVDDCFLTCCCLPAQIACNKNSQRARPRTAQRFV